MIKQGQKFQIINKQTGKVKFAILTTNMGKWFLVENSSGISWPPRSCKEYAVESTFFSTIKGLL